MLGIPAPEVAVKDYQRGTAYTSRGKLSVPEWAVRRSVMYAVSYAVHETCHFVEHGHGREFREVELRALSWWGIMVPYYATDGYPACLRTAFGHELDHVGHTLRGDPW